MAASLPPNLSQPLSHPLYQLPAARSVSCGTQALPPSLQEAHAATIAAIMADVDRALEATSRKYLSSIYVALRRSEVRFVAIRVFMVIPVTSQTEVLHGAGGDAGADPVAAPSHPGGLDGGGARIV
jgi:hypothetical protein